MREREELERRLIADPADLTAAQDLQNIERRLGIPDFYFGIANIMEKHNLSYPQAKKLQQARINLNKSWDYFDEWIATEQSYGVDMGRPGTATHLPTLIFSLEIDLATAAEIQALVREELDLEDYEIGERTLQFNHNPNFNQRQEIIMKILNSILGTYGVEAVDLSQNFENIIEDDFHGTISATYLETGDIDFPTIIYNTQTLEYLVNPLSYYMARLERIYELNEQELIGELIQLPRWSAQELSDMPTIRANQTSNLKYEIPDRIRVWLSRMTVDDGMPYNNAVEVEVYLPYEGWMGFENYPGGPIPDEMVLFGDIEE